MKKLTGEFVLIVFVLVVIVIFGKLWLSAYDAMMNQYEKYEKDVEERVRIHEEMKQEEIEHYRKYGTDEPVVIFLGNNPPEKK